MGKRRKPIVWTPEMLEVVRDLRVMGVTAAKQLGMSRKTFLDKRRSMGLRSPITARKQLRRQQIYDACAAVGVHLGTIERVGIDGIFWRIVSDRYPRGRALGTIAWEQQFDVKIDTKTECVDFRNGNPLDLRKENLYIRYFQTFKSSSAKIKQEDLPDDLRKDVAALRELQTAIHNWSVRELSPSEIDEFKLLAPTTTKGELARRMGISKHKVMVLRREMKIEYRNPPSSRKRLLRPAEVGIIFDPSLSRQQIADRLGFSSKQIVTVLRKRYAGQREVT